MNVEIGTLAAFFGVDDPKQVEAKAAALAKNSKAAFARVLPGPLRQAGALSVLETGRGLLDSPVVSILGQGWSTARDLHRFCDQGSYPPDKISEYTLVEHEVALKRNPVVELVFNGAPTGLKLQFEIKLALSVLSAVLSIQNGRIIGARIGDCHGGGKYSCASMTLAERKTSKFRLPGSVSFGQGISLGKPYGHVR